MNNNPSVPAAPKFPFVKSMLSLMKNPWINIGAIAAGVAVGLSAKTLAAVLVPPGDLFLSMLKMCVLPIVFTAITASVAKLLRSGAANRYLNRIILVFALGACMGAVAGVASGVIVGPGEKLSAQSRTILGTVFRDAERLAVRSDGQRKKSPWELAYSAVPSNVFFAFSSGQSLAVVFISILLGIALGLLKNKTADHLVAALDAINGAFLKILNWVLYLLPIGLCCLVAGQVGVLGTIVLAAMAKLIVLYFAVCILLCILYTVALRQVTGMGVIQILAAMRDPLLVAFVTRSSIAAIPLALDRMRTELNQPDEVASLVIPLSVVINRHAFILLFSMVAVFVAQLFQIHLSLFQQILLMAAAAISGMAAVGAPSAIAPMVAYVLIPLGLPASIGVAIIAAMGPIIDPIATLTNLYGGCATTALVANLRAGKSIPRRTPR